MKRIILVLVIVLSTFMFLQGENVTTLLKHVSYVQKVEKVKIPRFMMTMVKSFAGFGDIPIVRGVHGMEVFDLEECSAIDKQNCINKIGNVKDKSGYDTLIRARDGEDDVRIMIKEKGKYISEVVIINIEGETPSIVRFWGKMKKEDLNELMAKDK